MKYNCKCHTNPRSLKTPTVQLKKAKNETLYCLTEDIKVPRLNADFLILDTFFSDKFHSWRSVYDFELGSTLNKIC